METGLITKEERRAIADDARRYAYEEAAEYLESRGDTWGAEHFRSRCPTVAPELKIDNRPKSCRDRLRDEGKAYPKSGCAHCINGGLTGCPFDKE